MRLHRRPSRSLDLPAGAAAAPPTRGRRPWRPGGLKGAALAGGPWRSYLSNRQGRQGLNGGRRHRLGGSAGMEAGRCGSAAAAAALGSGWAALPRPPGAARVLTWPPAMSESQRREWEGPRRLGLGRLGTGRAPLWLPELPQLSVTPQRSICTAGRDAVKERSQARVALIFSAA